MSVLPSRGAGVIHLVVPGSIDQRTGGYLYDARMVREVRARGRDVVVHELEGRFPDPDAEGVRSLEDTLAGIPSGATVVVDGLAGGGSPGVLAAASTRLHLIALVHHPLADETGLPEADALRFFASERDALACVRGVVVTSGFTARRLAAFGVPPGRVRVAVPGTEPGTLSAGGNEGDALLLCVASITPRKGHETLLEALHVVRDLRWQCTLAGSAALDPGHAAHVRARVQALGLEDRVSFQGELRTDELDALYARSTLFVLASHYEGYGMALTEALVRGLPVLSTTGGAIPDTVPDGAGVLVPPADAEALASALRTLLTEPGALDRLRAGALRAAVGLPDWTRAARTFEAAVDELAGFAPVEAFA